MRVFQFVARIWTMITIVAVVLVGAALGLGYLSQRLMDRSPVAEAAVELVSLKDGTAYAGQVTSSGGVLRIDHALIIQIKQPEKDAPSDTKATLSYSPVSQGDLKLTGTVLIAEANINLRQVLSSDSPLVAALSSRDQPLSTRP